MLSRLAGRSERRAHPRPPADGTNTGCHAGGGTLKAPRNKSGSLKSNAGSLLEGLPRLADLQMEDACHERRLLLLGFNSLLHDLAKRAGGNGIISPEERRRRIIEIYQRCYFQETDRRKQVSVLADFVGCFPHLALQADWFQKTVTSVSLTPDFSVGGTRRDTLLAVAKGFKRAADPTPRLRKQMRNHALETAREFRLGTAEQLKIWWSSLNAKDAAQEWLDERATDLTGDFCTRWNERESTWRKSWSCQCRGTSQSKS